MFEDVAENRSFVMELVYGVIRWYRTLTRVRARFVRRPPDAKVEAVLLAGLYQMLFMDHVEEYAIVHETVEAAKAIAGPSAGRFVNAVLRRVQTEGRPAILGWMQKLSPPVRWSHPDILWNRWAAQYGEREASRLCEWNNGRADVVLRVNLARIGLDAFRDRLRERGIQADPHPADPQRFLVLSHGVSVADLPGYANGWFYVQDPSTAIAPDLLAVKPGERVLDACAAPGGKTGLLAEALRGKGVLIAVDADATRVTRLRENLDRLGAQACVLQANAAQPASFEQALRAAGAAEPFDAVLVDVPCTNTGVIRRRPDVKWRFSSKRLEVACFRQKAILLTLARWVRPGGRLGYSTCSLEPEENEQQVRDFIKSHPEFECVEMKRTFPPDFHADGAFASLLQRR